MELGSITPTVICNWIRWMMDRGTAPSYRHVCFVHVSTILSAAVDDKKIAANPCKARSVTKPQRGQQKVTPWPDARLKAVWLALPPGAKITVSLGTGGGLRQGEMFGLSVEMCCYRAASCQSWTPTWRCSRVAALLRLGADGRRGEHQSPLRVPRPRGFWLHPPDVHIPHALQPRTDPPSDRRTARLLTRPGHGL